ncbi:MAG: histidine kinase, partial [Actinomycetota bacterium]
MAASESRFQEIGPWLLDAILSLSLALIAVTPLRMELAQGSLVPGAPTPVLYGLALAHTLPVAVHRRYPRGVLWWSLAVAAAALFVGPPLLFLGIAQLVILFASAARCDRRTSLAGLLAAEGLWAAAMMQQDRPDPASWLLLGAVMVGAWLLGDGARRREEQAAAHAVTAERLRIARELHDVVAHSISVIAVQSGVGAHVIATDPEEARKALVAIEHTSREA